MRITQRELRKIIREELSRTSRGLQESGRYVDPADVLRPPTAAEQEHFQAQSSRKLRAHDSVKKLQRQYPNRQIIALHIIPADDRFWFYALMGDGRRSLEDVPGFFQQAFMQHLPDPEGGPLEVWRKLIAWCRKFGFTHITTDFLHEMGFPVPDESMYSLREFQEVLAEEEDALRGKLSPVIAGDEPALEDM